MRVVPDSIGRSYDAMNRRVGTTDALAGTNSAHHSRSPPDSSVSALVNAQAYLYRAQTVDYTVLRGFEFPPLPFPFAPNATAGRDCNDAASPASRYSGNQRLSALRTS